MIHTTTTDVTLQNGTKHHSDSSQEVVENQGSDATIDVPRPVQEGSYTTPTSSLNHISVDRKYHFNAQVVDNCVDNCNEKLCGDDPMLGLPIQLVQQC